MQRKNVNTLNAELLRQHYHMNLHLFCSQQGVQTSDPGQFGPRTLPEQIGTSAELTYAHFGPKKDTSAPGNSD